MPDESSSYADAALAVAEREGLTAYAAAYVDLALREKLVLASLDGPMRKAAEQFGVTVFRPQGPPSAQCRTDGEAQPWTSPQPPDFLRHRVRILQGNRHVRGFREGLTSGWPLQPPRQAVPFSPLQPVPFSPPSALAVRSAKSGTESHECPYFSSRIC